MNPAALLSIVVKTTGVATAAGQLETLDKAGRSADDSATKHAKTMKRVGTVAAGAFAGGIGLGVVALKGTIKAAEEAQVSNTQMSTQLKALGINYKAHAKQIDTVIQKTSKLAGLDDEDLQNAFTNIVRTTGDVTKSLKLTGLAADFARAKHMDVAKAGAIIGKVMAGNVGALKRYGIATSNVTNAEDVVKKSLQEHVKALQAQAKEAKGPAKQAILDRIQQLKDQAKQELAAAKEVDKHQTAQNAIAEAQKKFGGQAEQYGKTAAGAQDRFRVAVENLQEAIGTKLLPVLTKVALFASKFIEGLTNGSAPAIALAVAIGGLAAALAVAAAAQLLMNLAVLANPYVAASVAIIAFAVLVVTQWDKIQGAFEAVWNWLKQNWPLLLAILAGPFGLAVLAITKHAGDIKDAVVSAFNKIVGAVHAMASAITGLGGWVINRVVDGIKATASTVVAAGQWVTNRIADGIRTVTSLLASVGGFIAGQVAEVIHNTASILIGAGSWITNRVADGIRVLTDALAGVGGWLAHQVETVVHDSVKVFGDLGGWIVAQIMNGIKGAGKAVEDAASWLKDKVVDAVKGFFGIKSPSKVMQGLGGHIASGLIKGVVGQDIPGFIKSHFGSIGNLAQSLVSSGWKGLKDFFGGTIGKLFGGGGGGGGAKGSSQLLAWLTTALKVTGHFSDANLQALTGRAMQESGGNPGAINLWDSNAAAGHPSKGLLQTIDSTFAAYHLPGFDNIWNPIDNAIAAIRYMYGVYGHIVGPSGTGYALGTRGARKGWAMVGEQGPELVRFNGGESVQANSGSTGGGMAVVHEHHYHGPVVQDAAFIKYLQNLGIQFGRQNGRPAFGG